MTAYLEITELSSLHADEVVAVERRCYPEETRDAPESILERLREGEDEYVTLNLGLFRNDRLVGYILAHLNDTSDLPDWEQTNIVYVDDVAILPKYRRHLARILRAFARETRNAHPGLPLVANGFEEIVAIWQRHARLLESWGYRLARVEKSETSVTGKPVYLVRWNPLHDDQLTAKPVHMHASFSVGSNRELGIRVVSDEEGLLALRADWDRIESVSPNSTVFQSHTYQSLWWRYFGLKRELYVVCVYDGLELIGIAPFQLGRAEVLGRTLRELNFIGSRWEVDRPGLLLLRDPENCARAIARFLSGQTSQWDIIQFHEQNRDAPVFLAFVDELRRQGLLVGISEDSVCPFLRFEGSWDELLMSKSQKFRKNLKSGRRKLETHGTLEYASVDGDAEQLYQLLEEYRDLETRGWKAQAGVDSGKNEAYMDFYDALIEAFADRRGFIVRTLRIDDDLIAATFGLEYRNRYYSLHIANDRRFAKASPGTVLESMEIQECFERKLDEYDFLGGFVTNKLRWTQQVRRTHGLHVYRRKPLLTLIYFSYFKIKPALRQQLIRLGYKPATD